MDIASTEHHSIAECGHCFKMFLFHGPLSEAIRDLTEQYDHHLRHTPECKEWHDKLPTLQDLCGLLE